MPILEVTWVSPAEAPGVARRLADAAGRVFGSAPGSTWVRLHRLDPSDYAENDAAPAAPVFVSVLARAASMPDPAAIAQALADATALCLGVDASHVHVMFEPPADGRVYFGGKADPRAKH